MSSRQKIVKCAGCNIVISEVLSFLQNKLDVMDVESLIRVCVSGFTADDIEQAKILLFESLTIKRRKASKRKDGKAQREVEDMICLFQDTDPENMPIFVARDLQKLPPICFDHVDVTRLLKDILVLKADVNNIRETYIRKEDFEKPMSSAQKKLDPEEPCFRVDYVNCKRGAFKAQSCSMDSGPFGMTHTISNDSTANESTEEHIIEPENVILNASARAVSLSPTRYGGPKELSVERLSHDDEFSRNNQLTAGSMAAECILNEPKDTQSQVQQAVSVHHSVKTDMHPASTQRARCMQPTEVSEKPVGHQDVTFADILKSSVKPQESEWIKVTRKSKNKNKFIGNKGTGCTDSKGSFKAAVSKVPFYIYNVDKGASINDIVRHIYEKTNVTVELTKMKMKLAKKYEAYKFDIPRHKLPLFMNENMWPEGISFRRYIYFKNKSSDLVQANRMETNMAPVDG